MTSNFPIEEIPSSDNVFRRVYRGYIKNGRVKVNAFTDPPPKFEGERVGLSVLWEKHATIATCKSTGKEPENNGVAALSVGKIREIDALQVVHDPKVESQAHSQIYGRKDEEVRVQLSRAATVVVNPD